MDANKRDAYPMLFALESTHEYGERVALHLGRPLEPHEERGFEDGEQKVRPLVNVRNGNVFVLQSLYGDPGASVNDKLCRLLFFIGALHDAAAATVTAVVPYLCYARKDRKTQPRDPVTTRYVAALFEAVSCDRIVTIDVHNLMAYQNAFRCRTEHLEATTLFVDHFAATVGADEVTVVSPDPGGVKRAERFQAALGRRLGRPVGSAFVEKYRAGGVLRGEALIGPMQARTAIILDDLISTGGTLVRAARACKAHGAQRVFAAATHGLFMKGAEPLLQEETLDRIVVADTVPPFRLAPDAIGSRVIVLDSAPLVAEAIRRIQSGGSLVELLEG
ncbi:MAG TPA: ribose-phosphate pyrophosphokinase [Gammaproteobacteria bacterium]|nr:ribose-phosphate pyrophosphokinase [Gammaproteobacteria bacterium]